jgi:hypothetical protein
MQAGSRRRNAAGRQALIAEMGGALGERDGNRDSNAVAHQADAARGMSSPNMPVRDARPRGDERLITGRNPVRR